MLSLLLVAALQAPAGAAPAQDTLLPRADSAAMATAYADPATRELVRLARGRREALDASVFHYTATSRQRLSAGIQAFRRDRVLYRREAASTIEWWRDRPARVVVTGAREAVPVAMSGVRVPDDLVGWAHDFVPQPGDDRLFITPSGGGFSWHPLVEGGEALYRYATGDTTVIRLPDGRELRLVELRVTPRERDVRLITGTFWIELEGHSVVQAVFRPAREFDLDRDLATISPEDADDVSEVPRLLKPIRFDIRYVTVEYGLWEMRWWMPRLMAVEGWVQMGGIRVPFTMEQLYSDYTVEADRWGLPELPPLIRELAGDSTFTPRPYTYPVQVVVPDDTASLLVSDALPPSIFSEGESLMTDAEMRELGRRLDALPPTPLEVAAPTVTPPWALGQGLLRYNRVEGLSAGARVDWDLTRVRLDLTGRVGTADRAPRAELGLEVPRLDRTWRVAGYHRLATMDPAQRPFGAGNSLSALLFGRDDGLYFRTTGAEVRVEPAPGRPRYELRLYAERQRLVDRKTHFSLPYLFYDEGFRENIPADTADQVGLAARFGISRGIDPAGWRGGAWLDLVAESGTYTFARPGITLRGAAPLPGKLVGALELGAGTTFSPDTGAAASPRQARWFLGGPATLRGFTGGELSGRDHARARAEVATRFPAARVAVFSDAGWAGRFDAAGDTDIALSAGMGASLLDGLVRLDLARTLQPVSRWRLELYIDALF